MTAEFVIKTVFILLVMSNIVQWYIIFHLQKLIHLNRSGMEKIGDILGPMIDLIEKLEKRDILRSIKESEKEVTDDGR